MSRRGSILIFSLALLFACLGAVAITHVCAYAMGAPTENSTIPDPTTDTLHQEIKPPVPFILQGETSQPPSTSPGLTADLWGTSATGYRNISGSEQWYLDIDINAPGWLYIYEYYPQGSENQGNWIVYKWQLPEPGQWRLGPFRPGEDEPEGQHIYRLRFHANGEWAPGDSGAQNSSLVYWNYDKGTGDTAQPASVPVTPQPASAGDRLLNFLVNPVTLLVAPSIIVVIVLMGWFARRSLRERRYLQKAERQPLVELLEQPSAPSRPPAHGARAATLELPNGLEIRLGVEGEVIGRAEVARSLGLDELGAVSRQHFRISFEDGKPHIEDMGSANGTTINGRNIRGEGSVELQDGDVIEMAGKVSLKFKAGLPSI